MCTKIAVCCAAILITCTSVKLLGHADEPFTATDKVTLLRVPNGGIQPQTVIDSSGTVHLIYFSGDAKGGDIFYSRSTDSKSFTKPLRVNSQIGSAIAIGTIRGAHLAVGKGGRVHVAWMGADKSEPRGPSNSTPMLYSRLDDARRVFEPQKNVIQKAFGLDGGGSVAADDSGNVYVVWHAPELGTRIEESRFVWVAHSKDEGKSFTVERKANTEPTGVCGCCGIRAFVDRSGTLYVLYRSAHKVVHRDMYLLASTDNGNGFRGEKIHTWEVATCPMSSMFLTDSVNGAIATWETDGQVYFAAIEKETNKLQTPVAAPGVGQNRKHSVVASNANGETLLVWTEGTGWNRGGSLAWHVFGKDGKATNEMGRIDGVPKWSLVATIPRPDGGWVVLY